MVHLRQLAELRPGEGIRDLDLSTRCRIRRFAVGERFVATPNPRLPFTSRNIQRFKLIACNGSHPALSKQLLDLVFAVK